MEVYGQTTNINIKIFEIKEGEDKFKCEMQIIKNFLQVTLYLEDKVKYENNISLLQMQNQIITFSEYNINEIFKEINKLNIDKFRLMKESNKYKLSLEFNILDRKKYLDIYLHENENLEKNDLIKRISDLKEIIKNKDEIIINKDEKIKQLEEEIKKFKNIETPKSNNDNLNNFNIKFKDPIHKLNYHRGEIYCAPIKRWKICHLFF